VDPLSETLTAAAMEGIAQTLAGATDFEGAITRVHPSNETVAPDQVVGLTGARRAFNKMSELATRPGNEHFAVKRVIGEGGMGVVHLAEQRSLGRKVVLKSLRPAAQSEENTLRLLQEAWVTGRIEHPNIVPVHDVTIDSDGRPLIVLKRIEGETWSELMGDAEAVLERFGADDLLEWNLRLYMQVCNAVHFAHSRGIVHRDLKPDNVMIGSFGEVYVVDWGIAVSLQDDAEGRLPAASQVTGVAGTPCYMAPEMLIGDGTLITEATDVYLLGAILHEILGGLPPHRGDTLSQVLASVSEGPEPPQGPEPLVDLCCRAMAQSPADRPETAEAIRLEIQQYLRQRSVAELVVQAQERLTRLQAIVSTDPAAAGRTERQALYDLYSACKFGFQEALRTWPDGQDAKLGLHQATTTMIAYELARGEPELATPLLAELESPAPGLAKQVEEACRAQAAAAQEMAHLAALGQQIDPTVGQRTRTFFALCIGTLFSVTPLSGPYFSRVIQPDFLRLGLAVLALCLLTTIGLVAIWARESMMKTAINRRVMATAAVALVSQILLLFAVPGLGLSLRTAEILMLLLWALVTAMLAIGVDMAMAPAALGYLVGFYVAVDSPDWTYTMMSLTNLGLTINLVWVSVPVDVLARFGLRKRPTRDPGD